MASYPDIVLRLKERVGAKDALQARDGGWLIPTWTADRGRFCAPDEDLPPDMSGTNSNVVSHVPGTAGYRVLVDDDRSVFHSRNGTAVYTFVGGDPVEVTQIDPAGHLSAASLGPFDTETTQHVVVEARVIVGIQRRGKKKGHAVLHRVAVPGRHPHDISIPTRKQLLARFPDHEAVIKKLAHDDAKNGSDPPRDTPLPYIERSHPSVTVVPILTTGDDVGGVRFGGIPDGIGAYRDPDHSDQMRVLMTHELFFHQGKTRAHGARGAYVSEWWIDLAAWDGGAGSLSVLAGRDVIQQQYYWSFTKQAYRTGKQLPFERLCSADLPPPVALRYQAKGTVYGTDARLFLGGEETHTQYRPDHGRAHAHVVSGCHQGETWELPRLGRCSFENVVLSPYSQLQTVGICLDDATNKTGPCYSKRDPASEVYIWVGQKQADGHPTERAGLRHGTLFGLKVRHVEDGVWRGVKAEDRVRGFGHANVGKLARFELEALTDRSRDDPFDEPGVAQQKESIRRQITQFLRIEDGAWDPRPDHAGEFYFVTTDEFNGNSRLFRLRFHDITRPTEGGEIEIVLDAKRGREQRFQMLDSACVDPWGRVLLQEDSGDKEPRSRTLVYEIESGDLREAAIASGALFGDPNGSNFITWDEESSGIIPVFDLLGEGWYLTTVQAHDAFPDWMFSNLDPRHRKRVVRELAEPGQLLALFIPRDISSLPSV